MSDIFTDDDVLKYIDEMRSVTPGELVSKYGGGDHNILKDQVYVAFGLSKELLDVLLRLIKQKKIVLSPCQMGVIDWLVTNSQMPADMKMASGKYDWADYKTERWYPCEFTTVEWFKKRLEGMKISKQEKDKILRNIV